MISKRIWSYVIDIFIVAFISSFFFSLFFIKDYNRYMEKYDDLIKTVDITKIDDDLIKKEYEVNKSMTKLYIIKAGITFLYFCILPYLWKGQTLGKKIFKLSIAPYKQENYNTGLFILRGVIVSNFLFDFITVLTLIICPMKTWISINEITTTISYIIYLTILISSATNIENRGLHDILCRTSVINIKRN